MNNYTGGEVDTGMKRGGDTHQGMEAGTFAGEQADNSEGGWGTMDGSGCHGSTGRHWRRCDRQRRHRLHQHQFVTRKVCKTFQTILNIAKKQRMPGA